MKTIHPVIIYLNIFYVPVHCDTIRQQFKFLCYQSCRAIKRELLIFSHDKREFSVSLLRHKYSYIKSCICVCICVFQVLSEIRAYWIAWATCMPGDMKRSLIFMVVILPTIIFKLCTVLASSFSAFERLSSVIQLGQLTALFNRLVYIILPSRRMGIITDLFHYL